MNIREVKVSELVDFVESEEYSRLDVKPISPLRAVSQFYNPVANPDDTALVFASENNILLGFAGLLPDKLNIDDSPVSSNSGWWIKPGKNHLALPIFLRALQKCNNRMFFTDCSAQTKSILEKTGLFGFLPQINGERYFLRFCLSEVMNRKGAYEMVTSAFGMFDIALNSLFSLRMKLFMTSKKLKNASIYAVPVIDDELSEFITEHSHDNILKQTGQKLNWIMLHSWLTTDQSTAGIRYPFSYRVENYSQEILLIKKQNEICGVLLLTIRDGMASVPYIFYRKEYIKDIALQIRVYLENIKAESVVVFNPQLRRAMKIAGFPSVYTKKITRFAGYSNDLKPTFEKNRYFQDGDGDVAFT
jgi:hypothetical protein